MNNYPENNLSASLLKCADDLRTAASSGQFQLSMQVRAYDVLDLLLSLDGASLRTEAAETFCREYEISDRVVEGLYDEPALKDEADAVVEPLRAALNEARFEAASAASLHEFAKDVYQIWQTSGIFARRRALRELRERAGFRLESHRIGNYVAKTFDLMNEAQARFARAQQAVFAADVTYKIKPGLYARIYSLLEENL